MVATVFIGLVAARHVCFLVLEMLYF